MASLVQILWLCLGSLLFFLWGWFVFSFPAFLPFLALLGLFVYSLYTLMKCPLLFAYKKKNNVENEFFLAKSKNELEAHPTRKCVRMSLMTTQGFLLRK